MTPLMTVPDWPAPSARVEPLRLVAGEHGRIVVTIDVPDGCHIQSHQPAEPFLIPTVLDLVGSHGLALGAATYPVGDTEHFDWTPVVLNVYRGAVEIDVPIRVEVGATPGRRTISGRVRYQGCTANVCLPPAVVGVEVDLEITSEVGRT